jgi:flagellum-specific peptidoglycan hydrolase FlgJ
MELISREDWVKKYWLDAVAATAGTKIFPETLMAQAVVESQQEAADGKYYPGLSLNARKANNYFGIKDSVQWKGETIRLPTSKDGTKVSTFRKYPSFRDSMIDYVNFLQSNPRYTTAGVFKAPDYVSQIVAIAKAGYAEGAGYAQLVTNVANSVKRYVKDIIVPMSENGKKIMPILIAALIITGLLISKNLKS